MSNTRIGLLLIATVMSTALFATSINGVVIEDATGEPVIGASVVEKGTSNGVITDFDGNFNLEVSDGAIIQVSYMGFATQELPAAANMKVSLKEDAVALQEVVAIGYGSQKKKEVTGSVASVKAGDFNSGVKQNPMGLLQGRVAGLNISHQGGDPTNTSYNIQIRGFSTLDKGAGTSPLYIVDGIPVNNIDNISPDEIASMDVLKDGSAAAIYGTRGTNGVIIITTKRGNDGGNKGMCNVDYSGYITYSAAHKDLGMLSASEFRNLAKTTGGKIKPSIYNSPDGKEYNTDYMDEVLRDNPITHYHNIALSGASDKFSYRAAITYKDAKGIVKNSGRQEVILKFAANQKALDGWLDFQYDASYMHYKNDYQCSDFKQVATLNPTYPIYDSKNTTSGYFLPSGSGQSNPIAALNQKESNQTGNFFRGSIKASLNIKPVPGLKVSQFIALEDGDNYDYSYTSKDYDTDRGAAGIAERKTSRSFNQLYESTIDYAGQWGNNTLSAVLGWSYQKFLNDGSTIDNGGFNSDFYKWYRIGDGTAQWKQVQLDSYTNDNVLAAAFLRINYNYDERYLLSASIRAEGSSRFGVDNKWGWFPAVSVGWRLKNEAFLKDVEWLNDLKIRYGFGVTGNNLGSDLKSVELLTRQGYMWLNGQWVNTFKVGQNANPDLRWEKKIENNLGIDFAFLDNRLSGTIDLYVRKTKDLLWEYDVPSPPYMYDKLLANCGQIKSKGIEITLTGVPVKNKNWEWTSTFTIAFNNNKITKLSDPSKNLNYSEMLTGSVGENGIQNVKTQKIVEGQSVGTFYGYHYIGIDTKGNLIYEKETYTDAAGATKKRNKTQVIGHAQPIFTYGWNNTLRYKGWDLTIFLRGNYGNDVLNVKRWAYGPNKSQGLNIYKKDADLFKKGKGVYRQGVFSDYYLEDGSFIKLDNITLGYTWKFKDNKYIRSLRLYATGDNIATGAKYSGIDPDVNTSSVWDCGIDATGFYPSVSNVMVGVNISLF